MKNGGERSAKERAQPANGTAPGKKGRIAGITS